MKFKKFNGKKMSRVKIALIAALIMVVVLLAGGVFARQTYYNRLKPLSNSEQSKLFTVEPGEGARNIGQKLEEAELIQAAWAFEWYVRLNGLRDKLQAGTYALSSAQSVQDITDTLTNGKVDTQLVKIYPGLRLESIRDSLINQGFSAEEVDAALEPSQYASHPVLVTKPQEASLEGYIFPEFFERTAQTQLKTVITQSLDELNKRLTTEVRASIASQGLTVHQAVIMASIVGEEVSNPEEQKIVAQVFLKRFRQGIPLGADATTRYAVNKPKGALTAQDIASTSPYNTRKITGLPPGPISNFKESALLAIASPASTNYLFFVTGRDFVTRFSNTFAEHQALIDQYGAAGEE